MGQPPPVLRRRLGRLLIDGLFVTLIHEPSCPPLFATWLWIYSGYSLSTTCPEKPEPVPLYYAAARLRFHDLAEHLIAEHPEHINPRGGVEVTPMHVAALKGHADIFSLLLEHGTDLEGRGAYNGTPLHRASVSGEVEAGQSLLDRGADINALRNNSRTPLSLAAVNKHVEFVRMLLKRGARIDEY
jgi:ankyrin repeat protein